MGYVMRGIDHVRDGFAWVVGRLVAVAAVSVLVVVAVGGLVYYLSAITPSGFLPEEDQGAFFISIQLPDGASVSRTQAVVKKVEALM